MLNTQVWNKVAPFWPLQNLVACNPFWGYVGQKFDDVFKNDIGLFQMKDLPRSLEDVNMHSIKYLQAFFDDSQAIIQMPNKKSGLLQSSINILMFDGKIVCKDKKQKLQSFPKDPNDIIIYCLNLLKIPTEKREIFLHILLTTLYGWASFVKYKSEWESLNPTLQNEFLALRIMIFTLISDDLKSIVALVRNSKQHSDDLYSIKSYEKSYKNKLYKELSFNKEDRKSKPHAQFIFCIDVRSEPIRRQIEAKENYETFGFAGFFGIPVQINNHVIETYYPSCPVLLKPKHDIEITTHDKDYISKRNRGKWLKHLYSNFKYNFTTPLLLVDLLGTVSAYTMLKRLMKINTVERPHMDFDISSISLNEKVSYAKGFLTSIGLIKNFAKTIVICGHGSHTTNNTFATALDCGACGGRHGGDSAQIIAEILNDHAVRDAITKDGIVIPNDTVFVAALHNTTTNEITYHNENIIDDAIKSITLKKNITKSFDWSETRPEWGLAKNASFIVGPRHFTQNINLDGRSFLHSYDYTIDSDANIITTILTAPMVVGHWINSQYLFSTINNVAFGAGNKVTQNIAGKFAVMQGNASDIMHGLPLQSAYESDSKLYHEPVRLTTIVYGSKDLISKAINGSDILQRLFGNEWVFLHCFDIPSGKRYVLDINLEWKVYE